METMQICETADELVAPGKGILAADESSNTIKRRFDSINVPSTEENRRNYRELLFRTEGTNEFISGIILYDETLRQDGADGTPLVKVIQDRGMIPGIKVDTGAKPLAGAPGEDVAEYAELGARFTKWRGTYAIGPGTPSRYCNEANAHALARFAALSQEAGLVPIVEPEVLMDGGHDIGQCFEATEAALREMYYQLATHRVELEGTLLKTNMVLSGKEAPNRAGPDEVGEKTVVCLKRSVPAAVPGVVFLSGGQGDDEATANLNAVNLYAAANGSPWELSFSFGRGLQGTPLKAWGGDMANSDRTQQAFYHRAHVTAAARRGEYSPEMEN